MASKVATTVANRAASAGAATAADIRGAGVALEGHTEAVGLAGPQAQAVSAAHREAGWYVYFMCLCLG